MKKSVRFNVNELLGNEWVKNGDENNMMSISALKGYVTEQFDDVKMAHETYERHKNKQYSPYRHGGASWGHPMMTPEEILDLWHNKRDESCRYGRMLDEYIGVRLEGTEKDIEAFKIDHNVPTDDRITAYIEAFEEFVTEFPLNRPNVEYVCREHPLYFDMGDGRYVHGRFDALFFDPDTNEFIILDWKSRGFSEIQDKYMDKGLYGVEGFIGTSDYNMHTIQVMMYKHALEQYLQRAYGVNHGYSVSVGIVKLQGRYNMIITSKDKLHRVSKPSEYVPHDLEFHKGLYTFGFKKRDMAE